VVRQSVLGFDWDQDSGYGTVVSGTSYTIPAGTWIKWLYVSDTNLAIEVYINAAWRPFPNTGVAWEYKDLGPSDGVNTRLTKSLAGDGTYMYIGIRKKVGRA